MKDYRTEDQKMAAVRASMRMAGQDVDAETEAEGRRILRGEITADQSCLNYLESVGLGDTEAADGIRRRIAQAG